MHFNEQLYLQTGWRRARRIELIRVIFIATVAILNLLAVKMTGLYVNGSVVQLFGVLPLYFSVGSLLYAVTFPCTDIVSELVGRRTAARMVWQGFACSACIAVLCKLAILMPPADFWNAQEAYELILGGVPRIMAASMLSYIVSQNLDVLFFHHAIRFSRKEDSALRHMTNAFWKRALGTTLLSQFIDSIIFVTVAFWGTDGIPLTLAGFTGTIVPMIITTWLVKGFITLPLVAVIFGLERWIGYSNSEQLPDEEEVLRKMASISPASPSQNEVS